MKGFFLVIIVIMTLLSSGSRAQQSSCDYKVEILLESNEFESQDFKWRMRAVKIEGKPANITGTAEIEDSSGKAVKTYKPWTSDSISKQKTSNEYSPNLKPGEYEITSEISVDCDDTNRENNVDKKEITISGAEETKAEKEGEEIPEENPAKKGTSLQGAEKTVPEPTQSRPSSIRKTTAEDFDNVIELKSQNNKKPEETMATADIIKNPGNSEIIYESSSEKAKGLIMIFLLTLSVLLNIVLIWKR
ncbi:hypothetical protein HYX08_05355 [Candidatus Woesearchaeota archaeon]|nr:hypothetical protein [Candidatus Woesearchaeota archaeon]